MIIKLKRVEIKKFEEVYEISDKKNIVINTLHRKVDNKNNIFSINKNGDKIELIVPNLWKDKSIIYENNREEGYIESDKSEKAIDIEYSWTMNYKGREFKLYEIGFGDKGIYFVIKENNETISIISKELKVKNLKDGYEIFIKEDNDEIISIICCLFWNLYRGTSYLRNGRGAFNGTVYERLNTVSKNLKEKMDFEFIEKIAKQENYTINNKSKEAKKASIVGWILLLVWILIIILMAL